MNCRKFKIYHLIKKIFFKNIAIINYLNKYKSIKNNNYNNIFAIASPLVIGNQVSIINNESNNANCQLCIDFNIEMNDSTKKHQKIQRKAYFIALNSNFNKDKDECW